MSPYTSEEVGQLIVSLPTTDQVRLERAAMHLAGMTSWEWRDLYQETVRRCLDTRNFPRDVKPVVVIINVMRSVASAEWKRRKSLPDVVAVGDLAELATDSLELELNAEDHQLAAEDYAARIKMLEELVADDEEAQMVLMGLFDGLEPGDIRDIGGWTETQYATIRRRLRRRINARIGGGWSA